MKNLKFFKQILTVAVAVVAIAIPARAQIDLFARPRTVALVYPQAVNAGSSSNFCTDIHGYLGTGKIDIITLTNGACSAATLNIYTSPDRTNWSPILWANAISNSIIYTNSYYPVVQLATNIIMYPGTRTTPNASQAGFATSYVAPAAYTNTGAITLTTGLQTIGIQMNDQQRYIQFYYQFTGVSTNTVAAILTAQKQQD